MAVRSVKHLSLVFLLFFMGSRRQVVVVYVRYAGKLLLVKRSFFVRSFRQRWSIVSGRIEDHESDALMTAFRELEEEVGLLPDQVRLVKRGVPFEAKMSDKNRFVHPFLFDALTDKISLNWENSDFAWVSPEELVNFKLVEGVDYLLQDLLG